MSTFINLKDGDYTPYGLSAGAVAGDLVFAGGMALDLETMQRPAAADSIAAETRICIEEMEYILGEAGCALQDIVKCNCYLTEDSYRAEFWETWDEIFAAVGTKPLRLTQVVGIAADCRVELDCIAVRPRLAAD